MSILFWFLLFWLVGASHAAKALVSLWDAWQRWWTFELGELTHER
jgi:hypothetical protein